MRCSFGTGRAARLCSTAFLAHARLSSSDNFRLFLALPKSISVADLIMAEPAPHPSINLSWTTRPGLQVRITARPVDTGLFIGMEI